MKYKHMVIYVGRSSVFTDQRFTEKIRNALSTHEEHSWELINATPRVGALGDVSGIWMFFKRPADVEDEAPSAEELAQRSCHFASNAVGS